MGAEGVNSRQLTCASTNQSEGVVSKETVVLRRWGSSIHSDEGLTLETSAFRISLRWPIYIINSVDKTKFLYTNQSGSLACRLSGMVAVLLGFCKDPQE